MYDMKTDLDAMIEEVRRQTEKRTDMEDIPSFRSGPAVTARGYVTDGFNPLLLEESIYGVNSNRRVRYYRRIPGNMLRKLLVRMIRKLIRPVMLPVATEQEYYNTYASTCINEMARQIERLTAENAKMAGEIERLKSGTTDKKDDMII